MADEENAKPDDNSNLEEDSGKDLGEKAASIEGDSENTETSVTEKTEISAALHKQIMDEAQRAQDAVRLAEEGMAEQIKDIENSESES